MSIPFLASEDDLVMGLYGKDGERRLAMYYFETWPKDVSPLQPFRRRDFHECLNECCQKDGPVFR